MTQHQRRSPSVALEGFKRGKRVYCSSADTKQQAITDFNLLVIKYPKVDEIRIKVTYKNRFDINEGTYTNIQDARKALKSFIE